MGQQYDERSFLQKVYAARGKGELFRRVVRDDTTALKQIKADPQYNDLAKQLGEAWDNAEVIKNAR